MVTPAMMAKYEGKYSGLYANLIKKYGPPGQPIPQPPAAPSSSKPGSRGPPPASSRADLSEHRTAFIDLVTKNTPTLGPRDASANGVVMDKAADAANGLETSTFTVCARVRPLLGDEGTPAASDGESFTACVAGSRELATPSNKDSAYTEKMLLLTPKVTIMGAPALTPSSFDFDYAFGAESTNDEVYELACKPLIERALKGQVRNEGLPCSSLLFTFPLHLFLFLVKLLLFLTFIFPTLLPSSFPPLPLSLPILLSLSLSRPLSLSFSLSLSLSFSLF